MIINKPNQQKAIFLAKKQLPEFVCDAVNLEGINYTVPEVQTLLQGVTVGGHKLSDQIITLNQAKAWEYIFAAVEKRKFALTKAFACELHNIAAKDEALEWGKFRSGSVTIAGTDYLPPKAEVLNEKWQLMLEGVEAYTDIFEQAIYIFLQMARNQFFYDVNKRMGRFIMNGYLLQKGYPAINLPASRQLEFNQLMLDFYPSNAMQPMMSFMKACINPVYVSILNESN